MKRLLLVLAGIAAIIVLGSLVNTLGTTHSTSANLALGTTSATRANQTAKTIRSRHVDQTSKTIPSTRADPPAEPSAGARHAYSPTVTVHCAPHCTGTPQRHATALPRSRATATAAVTPLPKHTPSLRDSATHPLRVSFASAALHTRYVLASPSVAAPGAAVNVYGGGFAPGAALHLTLATPGQPPLLLTATTAATDGTFQATVTVPPTQTAPSADLTVADARGHSADALLVVQTVRPLAGIVPNVVSPGQHISFWAANFRPGEAVRIYAGRIAGTPLLTAPIGSDGRGSWSLSIPYGPSGNNQLVVIGDQGRAPVAASYLLLNLYPHASVNSYAPLPGSHINFFGGGFGPNEPVDLRVDRPDGPVLASATANKGGGVAKLGPFLVPFGLQGPHTFILSGRFSHVLATVGLIVQPFIPSARPSTYSAGPGTLITFYGNGFAPDELVRVYLGRTAYTPGTEVAALHTTVKGSLVAGSGSFALPVINNASKLGFALVGDVSGAVAWTSLQYLAPPAGVVVNAPSLPYQAPPRQFVARVSLGRPGPLVVANPPRALIGGKVSLWGTGFHPYQTVQLVVESRDNPQGWALGSVRSKADGTFSTDVTIPTWVTHADTLRAYAGRGAATLTARTAFEVGAPTPQLTPATYSGTVGSSYRLSGDGFAPGEQVSLYLDTTDTPPIATITSGGGQITFDNVHVPLAAAGTHTWIVRGAQGDVASVPYTLMPFTPYLLLSTYSSQPERPVSVTGKGFAPDETVYLFLGATTSAPLGVAQSDDQGSLSATAAFTIPTTARGPLSVIAVGRMSGQQVRATLNVVPFGPSLWLSGYAGHPGGTVSFTGTGFAREDVLQVLLGAATNPAATFKAQDGAFTAAGTIHLSFSTPGGMLPVTVQGLLSDTKVTLHYLVIPYKPGAGFEIKRLHGYTRLRLGAGGFAPDEIVQIYQGEQASGTPWRVLRADSMGQLPLLPVLMVRGTPSVRLAYTVVGTESGTQATAVYTPPHRHRAP
jgi:hypothetical protein